MPTASDFSADFNDSYAYIAMASGSNYYMANPEISPEDIAHALGMQVRWGGHCSRFYSVAEHSVMVSRMVPQEFAFVGLMHDATEAILVDVPAPWKPMVVGYKYLEQHIWEGLCKQWPQLPVKIPAEVKLADWRSLFIEANALIPVDNSTWTDPLAQCGPTLPHEPQVECWSPKEARKKFLFRFDELCQD